MNDAPETLPDYQRMTIETVNTLKALTRAQFEQLPWPTRMYIQMNPHWKHHITDGSYRNNLHE